jgi:hypothetical protein
VEGILVHYASISHVPICFWRAVFERKAKSEIVADLTQLEQIKKKKNLLHSLGLVYKSMRGMMTNSIDRDQWLNVTSESRDRI